METAVLTIDAPALLTGKELIALSASVPLALPGWMPPLVCQVLTLPIGMQSVPIRDCVTEALVNANASLGTLVRDARDPPVPMTAVDMVDATSLNSSPLLDILLVLIKAMVINSLSIGMQDTVPLVPVLPATTLLGMLVKFKPVCVMLVTKVLTALLDNAQEVTMC